MSESNEAIPVTPLRSAWERVRRLPLAAQIEDCADQLGHPELFASELRTSLQMIRRWRDAAGAPAEPEEISGPAEEGDDTVFYAAREIAVIGEARSFTCLAADVDPLAADGVEGRAGLDFLGVTCDAACRPVLGAVQSRRDASGYSLLLRGLAVLAEIAPPAQLEHLDRCHFRGFIGANPGFDLNLVLHDDWDRGEPTVIEQLTRDLAELALQVIAMEGGDRSLLRHIVCLHMNPDRFDGRLRFGWRV